MRRDLISRIEVRREVVEMAQAKRSFKPVKEAEQ